MERFLYGWLCLVLLASCGGRKGGSSAAADVDEDGGTNASETYETQDDLSGFIYVDTAPIGDLECFAPGYDAQGDWNDSARDARLDTSKVVADTLYTGAVIDFESDDPVPEALVEIYDANMISGTPQQAMVADENGEVTGTTTTCTPFAYRVSTDPALGTTKDTMEVSQVPSATASQQDFNSVSVATYSVIPALLGVSLDEDKGVVAGTAYDCAGIAFEGAQVVIRDADGGVPSSLVVKYFVGDFPNRNQEWTSADGLWVAINVPEGD
jgi:hypothetical protein